MQTAWTSWRVWAADHVFAVSAVITAIAAGLGGWDMAETRFIAVFAEGGMDDPLPAAVPLWAIAAAAGLFAAVSTGYRRPISWWAKTFVAVGAVSYVAWFPAIVAFLVVWTGLLSLHLIG